MAADATDEAPWLGELLPRSDDQIEVTVAQKLLFNDFFSYNVIVVHEQQQLHVVIRVRKGLHGGLTQGSCSLHLNWVGGGLCTGGEPEFAPWNQCHFADLFTERTLMICLRYPLMPESSGAQILVYIDAVMSWIASSKFKDTIKDNSPLLRATVDNSQLPLVSGDSAGAFAAFQSWFSGRGPIVKTIYLLYPMLATYGRDPEQNYMGQKQTRSLIREKTILILLEMLRRGEQLPRLGSCPPVGMDAAYLSSSSKIRLARGTQTELVPVWQLFFREPDIIERLSQLAEVEYHCRDTSTVDPVIIEVDDVVNQLDKPELQLRAFDLQWVPEKNALALKNERLIDQKPSYCPSFVIIHGTADTNCAIENVEAFVHVLTKLWPRACVKFFKATSKHHAFTYTLQSEWMQEVTDEVKRHISEHGSSQGGQI